jgi:NTE family protein
MGHLLEGDGLRRGDLLSFLYFNPKFIQASIELGQRDAQALFKGLPAGEVRWQSGSTQPSVVGGIAVVSGFDGAR